MPLEFDLHEVSESHRRLKPVAAMGDALRELNQLLDDRCLGFQHASPRDEWTACQRNLIVLVDGQRLKRRSFFGG